MDRIFREEPLAGRVVGIEAHYTPTILPGQKQPLVSWKTEGNVDFHEKIVTVKARKGIVIATGGNTGNVEFRRMFDPAPHRRNAGGRRRMVAAGRLWRTRRHGDRRGPLGHLATRR